MYRRSAALLVLGAAFISGRAITTLAQAPSAYSARCATCHAPNLQGTAHAPQLVGATFKDTWSRRSVAELTQYIKATMPPGEAGSLSEDEYADITTFILKSNDIAVVAPGPPASVTAAAPGAQSGASPITVSPASGPNAMNAFASRFTNKTVDKFVPVTDQMLQSPPPGDWLSWRRTLDGLGYSPLNQISRDNVQQLRLAWA